MREVLMGDTGNFTVERIQKVSVIQADEIVEKRLT